MLSGYCRTEDQARLVLLEEENGIWTEDCEYACCAFREICPIGREITQIRGDEKDDDGRKI